jgi:hypothetical protein
MPQKTQPATKKAVAPEKAIEGGGGHLIGYARVSSQGQDTAIQEAKLSDAG